MDITHLAVRHHGAHQGVTGSCHELFLDKHQSILIDCGQFQGRDAGVNEISFNTSSIAALVITHCHIDHVGRLPQLIEKGFNGPIYCTPASAKVLPLVMADALKLSLRGHHRQKQQRIDKFLRQLQKQLRPLKLDTWLVLPWASQFKLRLRNAGHIIGSAYAEFERIDDGYRVVFSGDLGCKDTPLLRDPTPLEYADLLFLESTYGDRLHESRQDRQERLQAVIEHAIRDKGTVLIPAFSIGRTQELLYELEDIIHEHPHWQRMTVILDSPLAKSYTQQYRQLKPLWDEEAKQRLAEDRHPLNFERLHIVESHREHQDIVELLKNSGEPAIVIAASGMCTGGRIVNYLKALLPDPRTDVIFVGYQAAGTAGREIQRYGPKGGYVTLDHEHIDIRAQIHTLGGYSAHADQKELLEFLKTTVKPVGDVRLVHGETEPKRVLAEMIRESGLITGQVSG